jgi:hypothetical protein
MTDNDRELLELTNWELLNLAAIAAGRHAPFTGWNPLDDDGDALRLAVKLKMAIGYLSCGNCEVVSLNGDVRVYAGGTDPYAATRRAIVRAAAEIGRKMT